MKFRYEITAQIRVIDTVTSQTLIPAENFVTLYDSPIELNFLNPIHQALAKNVARVCFEMNLLEEDRLKDLGMNDTLTVINHVDPKYLKQIRNKEEEL